MKYYIYNIITWALSCLHIIKRGSVHYRTEPRPCDWRSIKSMSDLDIVVSRGDMPEVPKEIFVVPNETGIISIPDYAIDDLPVTPNNQLDAWDDEDHFKCIS